MPIRDVSSAAQTIQSAIHSRQTPSERFRTAMEMSDLTHDLALAGVRRRNPTCTESEATRILVDLIYAAKRGLP